VGLDLEVRGLALSYPAASGAGLDVLDIPFFRVAAGETVGITGPSGSGKTSLLYVLTGIERPRVGAVRWGGMDLASLSQGRLDRWRRHTVGFVFQEFHLFPGLTALDNVLVPATFDHVAVPGWLRRRAVSLLADVGLADRGVPAARLSRGEMQRVALARALLSEPGVVVADEPTASLDAESAAIVADLLLSTCRAAEATLLVVSHDERLLDRLDAVRRLQGGRLIEQPSPAPR